MHGCGHDLDFFDPHPQNVFVQDKCHDSDCSDSETLFFLLLDTLPHLIIHPLFQKVMVSLVDVIGILVCYFYRNKSFIWRLSEVRMPNFNPKIKKGDRRYSCKCKEMACMYKNRQGYNHLITPSIWVPVSISADASVQYLAF